MFITLTIDTHQKKVARKIRFSNRKFNPAAGWRKKIFSKKRTLWQKMSSKFRTWKRSLRASQYRALNGQIAMF